MEKKLLRKFRASPKLKSDSPVMEFEPAEPNPEPRENYAADFGNSRPTPNSLSQAKLVSLQRAIGNQAVRRLLAERNKLQRAGEGQPEVISGKLPDHKLPAPASMIKGPPSEALKSDTTTTTGQPKSSRASVKDKQSSGDIKIVVNKVDFDFKSPQTDTANIQSKEDRIGVTNIPMEFNNPGGKLTTPFGEEAFEPAYTDAAYNVTGTTKKVVNLDFKLVINAPWGTNAGGVINVPSATDGIVTAEKQPGKSIRVFQQIAKDLKPKKQEESWVAPRDVYWAQALCERHEMFHSTDDWAWAQAAGRNLVRSYLNGRSVSHSDLDNSLIDKLDKAMQRLGTANFQFYTGGQGSYYSYAGEKRAFGDGKVPYQNLSQGVRAHGMTLMPAKLVEEVGALLDAGDITAVNWASIKKLTDKWPTLLVGLKATAAIKNKMVAKVTEAFTGPFTRAKADAIEALFNSTIADKVDIKARAAAPLSLAVNAQFTSPFTPAKEAIILLLSGLPFAERDALKAGARNPIVTLINDTLGDAFTPAKAATINELYNSSLADKPDIKTRTTAALSAAVNAQLALPFTQAKVDKIKQYTDLQIADLPAVKTAATGTITALITQLVGDKTHKVKTGDLEMIRLLYNCSASDKPAVKNASLPLRNNFVLPGKRRRFVAIFE